MKINTDLTKVLKKEHEEKWVALTRDQNEVVDYAEKLMDLRQRVGEDNKDVVYMKVLPSNAEFAF